MCASFHRATVFFVNPELLLCMSIGDASSASYFLAGAAITGGPVTVFGCGSESVQVRTIIFFS